jgi:3-deoxy-D-manno-octulosonate 8-phosphate phosphatase (KDO 8-P phosphatase)
VRQEEKLLNYYKKIKFLVMDVDGTLTDGKIYMGDSGEVIKAFDIKDGCGIKELLPTQGIIPVVITARSSKILENRCYELGVSEIYQGCKNKIGKLEKIIADYSLKDRIVYSLENVAYIGDDIMDIQCMKPVKQAGGLSVCPFDATKSVKDVADYICINKSGKGAVREFIDWLIALRTESAEGLEQVKGLSADAYEFLIGFCPSKYDDGRYELDNGVYANVMSYITNPTEITCYESHRKYIDVKYMIYGTELVFIQDSSKLKDSFSSTYNETADATLYNHDVNDTVILSPGDSIILYPNAAYRRTVAFERPMKVRTIVILVPTQSQQ